MRFVSRVLLPSLAFAFAAASVTAQTQTPNYTTQITLSRLLGGPSGSGLGSGPVPSAKVCATGSDVHGNPISFAAPTWGFILAGTPFCANVVTGALTQTLPVPDAAHTYAGSSIYYNFSIQTLDSSGLPIGPPTIFTNVPNVSGPTFALDRYAPAVVSAPQPSSTLGGGSGVPSSCTFPSLWVSNTSPTAYTCNNGIYVPLGSAGSVGALNTQVLIADPNGNGQFCSLGVTNGVIISTTCARNPFYWILETGQSLATAYAASPALSTTQPYSNLMLSPGVTYAATPLIPLVEGGTTFDGNTNVETGSSSLANSLTGLTGQKFGAGLHGYDGTAYAGLAQGSANFTRGIQQVTAARSGAAQLNYGFTPLAVTVDHGEWDYNNSTAFPGSCGPPCNSYAYESYLQTWQANYLSAVQAVAPGIQSLPMFQTQMNQGPTGEMAQAQWQACKDNPATIYCVGPKYFLQFQGDHLHITNTAEKVMGEYKAKAIKRVTFDHLPWVPLQMASATLTGSTVTLGFNIPAPPILFDTTLVAPRAHQGFEFYDASGAPPAITGVTTDGQGVSVTLASAPTGANRQLRYAWTCAAASNSWCGGASTSNFVGGNVRDSDSTVSLSSQGTGTPLYNWLMAGYLPLPSVPAPPQALVAASSAPTTASVSFSLNGISGYPITGVSITSTPAGGTGSGATSPILVTGLTTGTSYTFKAAATNTYGNSAASLASNAVVPGTITPIASWLLNGNYNDASGNNNTATAGGTGNTFITDPTGVHGTVLSDQGTGWAVTNLIQTPAYTKAGWVYLNSSAPCITGTGCNILTSYGGSFLWVSNSTYINGNFGATASTLALKAGFGSATGQYVAAPTAFPTNTWVHVAQTYAAGVSTLYINGAQVATGTFTEGTNTSPITLGDYGFSVDPTLTWDGYLSKLSLFNTALSPSAIAMLAAIN